MYGCRVPRQRATGSLRLHRIRSSFPQMQQQRGTNHCFMNCYGIPPASFLDIFLKSSIAEKVYTACARINNRIVPVGNLSTYLHYGTSEAK